MKAVKILVILFIIYAGLVAAFETWLGTSQPQGESSLLITTTDDDGNPHTRVVSPLEVEGQLYVAANHWPRRWYRRALVNPQVEVALDDAPSAYLAVTIDEEEYASVNAATALGPVFRLLTGFPPRYFVRLDPRP